MNGRSLWASVVALASCLAFCAGPRTRAPRPPDLPAPLVRAEAGRSSQKFEAGLEAALRAAPQNKRFEVLVDLSHQLDYRELGRRILADRRTKAERRAAVIAMIEQVASEQQARLMPVIEGWIGEGLLDNVLPVAIVNRLIVEGSAAGILLLAERPEVARVLREWKSERRGGRQLPIHTARPLGEEFTSWAIEAIGADRLWQQGLDGRGVVVAAIDTGVFEGHEQLEDRRLEGSRGWFDPVQGLQKPYDNHGHGTSVLSQAVGGNPDGRIVGVAPRARWAMAIGNWRNHYSRVRMTLAADWVLRVARPDVVINAWSHPDHDEGPCSDFDLPLINAWKASGMFVVFPAGNQGPGAGTGEAPAQLQGAFPDGGPVFSVAGLSPTGEIHRESSRGPSVCGSELFPSIAAPGAGLPFAHPPEPDNYGIGNGTSLTAGLVGGAVALLLQADPELDPWELERILIETARDLPPRGTDNPSGAGALDLPAALARIRE